MSLALIPVCVESSPRAGGTKVPRPLSGPVSRPPLQIPDSTGSSIVPGDLERGIVREAAVVVAMMARQRHDDDDISRVPGPILAGAGPPPYGGPFRGSLGKYFAGF